MPCEDCVEEINNASVFNKLCKVGALQYLECPTVSDMIKLLQSVPEEVPFVVSDPDTVHDIECVFFKWDGKKFAVTGEYGMFTPDEVEYVRKNSPHRLKEEPENNEPSRNPTK